MRTAVTHKKSTAVPTEPAWMSVHAVTPNNYIPRWILLVFVFIISATALWPFWIGLWPDPDKAFMLRDMMVPDHIAANDLALGMSDGAPRSMPQDTILAVFSSVVPASIFAAACTLIAACYGMIDATRMARDMAGARPIVQLVCGLFVVWNPFVIERLLQGQWTFAIAAMILPSIAYYSAAGIRSAQLVFLAFSGFTATGLILGAITALAFDQNLRQRLGTLVAALGVSAPWLLVSLINDSEVISAPDSVYAFSAGADTPLGTVISILGLGGIWNEGAIPPSRGLLAGIAGLAVFLVAITGIRELWRVYRPVAIVTAAGFLLPIFFMTPPGLSLMGWAVSTIPGVSIFRDSQKLVGLVIPGMVLLIAVALEQIKGRIGRVQLQVLASIIVAALIIATVPGYPKDIAPVAQRPISQAWEQVRNTVSGAPSGKVLLLPPGNYRVRDDGLPVFTPALKMVPGDPIDPQYLIVDGHIIDGSPDAIDLLQKTVAGDDVLAENGVGWVIVERASVISEQSFRHVDEILENHHKILSRDGVELYRVSNPVVHTSENSPVPAWAGMGIYWGISMGGIWVIVWLFFRTWYVRKVQKLRAAQRQDSESSA